MVTINNLIAWQTDAERMPRYKDNQNPGRWPPSVYYRYLAVVAQKINAKHFVELGTCGGGASLNVAVRNPNCRVSSIDIERLPQVSGVEDICPNFKFYFGDSVALVDQVVSDNGKVDLLFVDTAHVYDQAMKEYRAWLPHMNKGGIICFDDLNRETMDQVWAELPEPKTPFNALAKMHISGSPTDGGFGAIICS